MKYAWSVPEVTQISQMDCGPSCLKSVLQGFNIPVNFGRLREACQTDVDGTSVDTIEELACELGLDAQQVLVPINHLHLPAAKATPCILITLLPNNLTHFIVVWRSIGPWVQVMDPSHGKHWIKWEKLKQQVYLHRMSLPKEMWTGWANGDEYRLSLMQRLDELGFTKNDIENLFSTIFQHTDNDENVTLDNWLAISCLDASTTWTEALKKARALKKGHEAIQFLKTQYERAIASQEPWTYTIPRQYWWAIQDENAQDSLSVEAAVLVRIQGVNEKASIEETTEHKLIHSRINEPETSPWITLQKIFLPEQHRLLRWLIPIIVLAAGAVTLQALLFQGLLGMSTLLGQQQEFNSFIPMVFLFIVLSTLMELPITQMTLTLGRQLESQFRITLFNKIPKIHDPYFRSRLLTDMARRSHRLYLLRYLPAFAVSALQQTSLVIFTLIGILWLDVVAGLFACAMATLLLIASVFWQKRLHDSVAISETQAGVINMFYFDSLKGLKTIRSHAAQTTFENEQEIQLSRWGATHYDYRKKQTRALLFLDLFALLSLAGLMLSKTVSTNAIDTMTPSVLWFYWIMRLPYLVKHLSLLIMDLPQFKITLSLYTELLDATEVTHLDTHHSFDSSEIKATEEHQQVKENEISQNTGVVIEFVDVSLIIGGHQILSNINLQISAGQHIAIVGASGAGKSSLCELLLGWQMPTSGHITVNEKLLQGNTLLQLREKTAWVDSNIQLWDRSLLENLNYDHGNGKVHDAGLGHVLAGLPNGLQTSLGENGKRLSGGEGQRVRVARALGVDKPQLVILDEPCRGLDRVAREHLLQKIRTIHADATIVCITHDISEAIKFSHVVVVGEGQLLEQGNPYNLLEKPESALSRLHEDEQKVLHSLLQDETWQPLHLVNGRLLQNSHNAQVQTITTLRSLDVEENVNA